MAHKIDGYSSLEGDSFQKKLFFKLMNTSIAETGQCLTCGKQTGFKSIFEGYSKFCSPRCGQKHPEIQQKLKDTMISRYNLTSAFNSKACREKHKILFKSGQTGDKIRKKQIEAFKNRKTEILELRNKTNMKIYGNIVPANSISIKKKRYEKIFNMIELNISKQQFEIISKNEYGKITIVKHSCGEQFNIGRISKDTHLRCPKCHIIKSSSQQREILNYLTNLGLNVIESDRTIIKPYELDIFIPSKKLAIEFNGLYWHSDKSSIQNQFYHRNKLDWTKERGIRLINIFEDDFNYKKDIIFSRLNVLLNIQLTKIYARQCKIDKITNKETRKFLLENHLQGYVPAKINYGLYFNNELVSVMTFGKPRYNKKYEWELLRYCSKKLTIIVGGGQKILKHFKNNNIGSLISYSNLEWGYTSMYEHLGFELLNITNPGYSYYQETNCKRISRIGLQKKNFQNTTNIQWDEKLSENENANIAKCYKVWDCGQQVFVIK